MINYRKSVLGLRPKQLSYNENILQRSLNILILEGIHCRKTLKQPLLTGIVQQWHCWLIQHPRLTTWQHPFPLWRGLRQSLEGSKSKSGARTSQGERMLQQYAFRHLLLQPLHRGKRMLAGEAVVEKHKHIYHIAEATVGTTGLASHNEQKTCQGMQSRRVRGVGITDI